MKRNVSAELDVDITVPTTLEFQIAVAPPRGADHYNHRRPCSLAAPMPPPNLLRDPTTTHPLTGAVMRDFTCPQCVAASDIRELALPVRR
jgi:hypothetical protein